MKFLNKKSWQHWEPFSTSGWFRCHALGSPWLWAFRSPMAWELRIWVLWLGIQRYASRYDLGIRTSATKLLMASGHEAIGYPLKTRIWGCHVHIQNHALYQEGASTIDSKKLDGLLLKIANLQTDQCCRIGVWIAKYMSCTVGRTSTLSWRINKTHGNYIWGPHNMSMCFWFLQDWCLPTVIFRLAKFLSSMANLRYPTRSNSFCNSQLNSWVAYTWGVVLPPHRNGKLDPCLAAPAGLSQLFWGGAKCYEFGQSFQCPARTSVFGIMVSMSADLQSYSEFPAPQNGLKMPSDAASFLDFFFHRRFPKSYG